MLFVSGCNHAADLTGWWVNGKHNAEGNLTINHLSERLLVTVELPNGYETAPEFPHQLVVTGPGDTEAIFALSSDLAVEVELDASAVTSNGIKIELSIGYCRAETKDGCYFDVAELTLGPSGRGTSARGTATAVLYRPVIPQ